MPHNIECDQPQIAKLARSYRGAPPIHSCPTCCRELSGDATSSAASAPVDNPGVVAMIAAGLSHLACLTRWFRPWLSTLPTRGSQSLSRLLLYAHGAGRESPRRAAPRLLEVGRRRARRVWPERSKR